MEKSKLGLNVGVVGALAYLACWYGGLIPALLVVGYILLCESDRWLRRTAIKALTITFGFSLLGTVVGVLPDVFSLLGSMLSIFDVYFHPEVLYELENFLLIALNLAEMIIMLLLAFMALKQRTIVISFVEKLIGKFVD